MSDDRRADEVETRRAGPRTSKSLHSSETSRPTEVEAGRLPRRAADRPSISVGDTIDTYKVLQVLGRGGMGLVVGAHDPRLNRDVAIKLVLPHTGADCDEESKAQLLREGQAMAKLRHRNVVAVYGAGEHEDQVYVVMEMVNGGTLRDLLRRESAGAPLAWKRVVELFTGAGRGLAAAHDAGLIHRDFKPENVLVDDSDRVLVTDFGIASAVAGQGLPGEDRDADYLVGTPLYMAPECYGDEPVDERADQFSFCVALFEALYGQLPFSGDSADDYFLSIARGDINTPEVAQKKTAREIPDWLHAAILRGLSADPKNRFASMHDLLAEFGDDPEQARRLGAKERAVLTLGLAAFAIAWTAAMLKLDLSLTYALHYPTNFGFLALVVLLGWFAREPIKRSSFNRDIYGFLLAIAFTLVVLIVGSDIHGISPTFVGSLHLLVIGGAALAATAPLGRTFLPMALYYLGGFVCAGIFPELLLPILFSAHTVAFVSLWFAVRQR